MVDRFVLPSELTNSQPRILASTQFESALEDAVELPLESKSRTPGAAKDYFQFVSLVELALENKQSQDNTPLENRLSISWEEPDNESDTEIVTVGLMKRDPGTFSRGAPMEGSVKNLRPVLREVQKDPENPSYRLAYLGYFHDNLVRFTCWAKTNKEAIRRALWFETFMNNYISFYRMSGVARVLFHAQDEDKVVEVNGKKLYGRSLIYFVRTETIEVHSEKEIENVFINLLMGEK